MIIYVSKIQEPHFIIPSSKSLERTLKEKRGYYCPQKITQRKKLLTHAYTSHKPKDLSD